MGDRHYGVLVRWYEDRYFGFIRPGDGSRDMFVSGNTFEEAGITPRDGMELSYRVRFDRQHRPCAVTLREEREPAQARYR